MNREYIKEKLSSLALSFFRKDFFGIYHGSISAKTDNNRFIINSSETIFDAIDEDQLIELSYKKDYRWKDASIDANIHMGIYKQISDAKYITYTMAPFTTSYSLYHNVVLPQDYFGHQVLGKIHIYEPKQFDDWYDRASSEIPHYFLNNNSNIMIVRGYGVYAYHRDVHEMAKQLAILERSCRILMLDHNAAKLDIG
ncbi:MAG: class II aldolase and adducin N-terminal domain-containing protein [Campylobacterota bacterium]|nr:class II aldolase and adducin N-terminal domain-containing protein [Campylobacterota bacterium]